MGSPLISPPGKTEHGDMDVGIPFRKGDWGGVRGGLRGKPHEDGGEELPTLAATPLGLRIPLLRVSTPIGLHGPKDSSRDRFVGFPTLSGCTGRRIRVAIASSAFQLHRVARGFKIAHGEWSVCLLGQRGRISSAEVRRGRRGVCSSGRSTGGRHPPHPEHRRDEAAIGTPEHRRGGKRETVDANGAGIRPGKREAGRGCNRERRDRP